MKLNKSETRLLADIKERGTSSAQSGCGAERRYNAAHSLAKKGLVTITSHESGRSQEFTRRSGEYHWFNWAIVHFDLTENQSCGS